MKLHIITVGQPKLSYAQLGWQEYVQRLHHYHSLRLTHIPDKHNDAQHLLAAAGRSYLIVLDSQGTQFTSLELADYLAKRAIAGQEISFVIGGPDGLPAAVLAHANFHWSFGRLTFPHDLAMVILVEALYRASTITAQQPYHR